MKPLAEALDVVLAGTETRRRDCMKCTVQSLPPNSSLWMEFISDKNQEKVEAVMDAMLKMVKLDVLHIVRLPDQYRLAQARNLPGLNDIFFSISHETGPGK
ncbi:MAG: hypothetical protein IH600_07595 [Bacteroidetes bacterium]|nr:hypothetical protein [Bacteroidota bacterium]